MIPDVIISNKTTKGLSNFTNKKQEKKTPNKTKGSKPKQIPKIKNPQKQAINQGLA